MSIVLFPRPRLAGVVKTNQTHFLCGETWWTHYDLTCQNQLLCFNQGYNPCLYSAAHHTPVLKTSACSLCKCETNNMFSCWFKKKIPREHLPRGNTPILPVHVAKEIMPHGSHVCWGLKMWNAPHYTELKREDVALHSESPALPLSFMFHIRRLKEIFSSRRSACPLAHSTCKKKCIQCNDSAVNLQQRLFVLGFVSVSMQVFFLRRYESLGSHFTSHILMLFLSEQKPPVANEHLFSWIRYLWGVTVSIA